MARFIGLDVHKKVIEACILDEAGKVLFRHRFPTSQKDLLAFAHQHLQKTDQLCLEATSNTWGVVSILKPFVAKVSVSNPLQTKAIASAKVKTDKVDAFILAQLLRCDYLPLVWEPDTYTQTLRHLTSQRVALVNDSTCHKNRIHSILHQRLLHPPVERLFSPKGRAWLQTLSLDEEGRSAIDTYLRLLDTTQTEIALFEQKIARLAYADPRAKLLMTLPGVDFPTAQTLLAAWGDLSRFQSPDQASAYLGLVPSTKASAFKCYHGPITKQGNSAARYMLVQACQRLDRNPGPLGVFFRRLKNKKGHNVAVCAAARKMATIAWYMLKNNEPYRYAQPIPTHSKLRNIRIVSTNQRRKSGPPKGALSTPALAAGLKSIRISSLKEVLASEGLPSILAPDQLPKGEKRFLKEANLDDFVSQIQKSKRIALKTSTKSGTVTITTS